MTDQDYFILTLAGIASELAFYGRQAADVHLSVGLPLTWVAEQKDAFKGIRSLLDWIASIKKEIEEAKNHEPYLIELIGQYYQDRNRGAWSSE